MNNNATGEPNYFFNTYNEELKINMLFLVNIDDIINYYGLQKILNYIGEENVNNFISDNTLLKS